MNILITGATGFVGSALAETLLLQNNDRLSLVVRRQQALTTGCEQVHHIPAIDMNTIWDFALKDIDVVIHCAARVHIINEVVDNPLGEYRKTNVDGTLRLASEAARLGVKRFIFISSIKVNGEETEQGRPFSEKDLPLPTDPYGISKLEAEKGLKEISKDCAMEVVVIRPVLVYGLGVKANFKKMMRWVNKGLWLPLGGFKNKRSLVSLDNLIDLIITCIDHPSAANQVFLVSDGENLSTSELLRRVALSLGVKPRLFSIPCIWFKFAAKLLGRMNIYQRLACSLEVDISKAKHLLGWSPPCTVDESLQKTAKHFLLSSSEY